ncbi:hypothetical protein KKC22_08890 [Myxococcota bacterium]|nr:hypothetical protein [Myxococcota bacterium]
MKTLSLLMAFFIIAGCSETAESDKCTVDIALAAYGATGCTGQNVICSPDIVENNGRFSITSASCQIPGTGDEMDSCADSSDCLWGLGCFYGHCEKLCSLSCSEGACVNPGWLTVAGEDYGICVEYEDCFGLFDEAFPCMDGFQCSVLFHSGIPTAFENYKTGCTDIQNELPQGEPCDNTLACASGLICSGTANPADEVICRPICENSEDCISLGSSVGLYCSTDVEYNGQYFIFHISSIDVGVCTGG